MDKNTENSSYNKLKEWRSTLDRLCMETGLSLKDVCDYTGSAYNGDETSFYLKLPRKRTAFIGIGMAFRQPLDVINSWITEYGGKRRLYVKDISEDLVWIYLINANLNDSSDKHNSINGSLSDKSRERNYYQHYEEYQSAAYAAFRERWDEIILSYEDTSDVEISLGQTEYGPEFDGLSEFIADHMDAFKTAYSKPRHYLELYVGSILTACRTHPALKSLRTLNSLRGYLDDSMINFLSGNAETVHVVDRSTGKRTIRIKHIPKGKKKYIALCLSLGMTTEDINRYLEMMGYAPLSTESEEERLLVEALDEWEAGHPQQRAFKRKHIDGDENIQISRDEEHTAVEQMLQLKNDLADYYSRQSRPFPYRSN